MGQPPNEFTFILIDTSQSMEEPTINRASKDIGGGKKKKKKKKFQESSLEKMTKFAAAQEACKTIVLTKKEKVETDKFGIITYNDEGATLVQELTNQHDDLIATIDQLQMQPPKEITRRQKLAGGLTLAIQEFAKQLKFVGNLMLRIFILTDNLGDFSPTIKRLTEIARDIGVYVDILYFGKNYEGTDEDIDAQGYFLDEDEDDDEGLDSNSLTFELSMQDGKDDDPRVLEDSGLVIPGLEPETTPSSTTTRRKGGKRQKKHYHDIREIAVLTDGLFLDGREDLGTILQHARKLGDIKDLEEGLGAFDSPPVRKKKLISAIAEELVPLDFTEIQDEIEGKTDLKCNICFQKTSPSGAPFYATARRCSYCHREMHLECAAKWAAQDQDQEEPWIFRCPFCFHLLKVNPAVTKLLDLQVIRQNIRKMAEEKARREKRTTTASRLTPEQISDLIEPCELCGVILEPEDNVLMCNKCHAAYHNDCFKQVMKENEHHCRRCGYEFV